MTLTELRYIVAVAQKKHFGQAAQACFVSQPTLSIAIKKLEQELDVKLFERSSKNEIRITDIGQKIIQQAQKVLRETQVINEISQQGNDPLSGTFKLGAIYTIGPYLLPDLIPGLTKNAPDLTLIIEENFTASLSQALKQGELDAIVISYPFDEPGIETFPLYEEPFVVAVHSQHEWVNKNQVKINELVGQDLMLLGAGHCFRDQVLKACPKCMAESNELTRTLEGSSLETIRHMVAAGTGITVLPCTSMMNSQHNSELIKIKTFSKPQPSRTVALAWRKHYPRKEAIQLIIENIQQCGLPGTLSIK
ncbi:MAG: LysR family transcriptional regulator [Gammaproteobacteria bacterium]|jgi:LysR family hydrogen peroxide-inducible transcriptional activator|nr:LysR family transcriptional regulator [Gammaproteobacteria bacterium]MBT3725459.1 LysR family transcriptional regulator [Gammaproteobacteria bacterium]MBT4078165.1 LysR family transcriptional regulator [Gammaproteobacteria bacterium]MBT4195572.1 LysR family transcriptional regulator [Gammaproteobacteria bacterium]MBT4448227.1 LysR family transcriptional regulator [Gammaproteobacteria bacterium]